MEIVIEIDKRAWMDEKSIREVAFEYEHGCAFDRAIREGLRQAIVLPEGHGRLIDADEIQFENTEFDTYGDYCIAFDAIDQADTIIEADKGVLDQINEKQDSLRATCKAWDEAISRDGYVD